MNVAKPLTSAEIKRLAAGATPADLGRNMESVIGDLTGRWSSLEVLELALEQMASATVGRSKEAYEYAARIVRQTRQGK